VILIDVFMLYLMSFSLIDLQSPGLGEGIKAAVVSLLCIWWEAADRQTGPAFFIRL
jgi:hypothetical protein